MILSEAERMKLKEIGIWVGIIAVLIGGLWLLITAVNNSPSPSSEPIEVKNLPEVSKDDFIKDSESASGSARLPSPAGEANGGQAKVTLIEYGDFQCPACAAYFPLVKQLSGEFGKDLRIVHRFFPLVNVHKDAMLAAQTAYAAGLQNKFWEMHDKLYENQNSWSDTNPREIFIGYAKDMKLDLEKFRQDLDADSTKQFINQSANSAISIGANSTPTFFVNKMKIKNPANYEEFKKIIQDEIEAR